MVKFYYTLGLQYRKISLKLKRKVGRYLSFYHSFYRFKVFGMVLKTTIVYLERKYYFKV